MFLFIGLLCASIAGTAMASEQEKTSADQVPLDAAHGFRKEIVADLAKSYVSDVEHAIGTTNKSNFYDLIYTDCLNTQDQTNWTLLKQRHYWKKYCNEQEHQLGSLPYFIDQPNYPLYPTLERDAEALNEYLTTCIKPMVSALYNTSNPMLKDQRRLFSKKLRKYEKAHDKISEKKVQQ